MNWRRFTPSVGLLTSLALFVAAGLIGVRYLLAAIDDSTCKVRCSYSLTFAGLLEDYRRVNGNYPVATDVATLKSTLRSAIPDWDKFINDAQVLFESDGSSYRLALFPNDYDDAGGRCGCLLLADRKIISFPAVLSAESRERLAVTLEAKLQQRSSR